MPASHPFSTPRDEPAFDFGSAGAAVGTAQRASLGRGLAFVLLLAASSLASVYVPLALSRVGGPDWVEGRSQAPRSAP